MRDTRKGCAAPKKRGGVGPPEHGVPHPERYRGRATNASRSGVKRKLKMLDLVGAWQLTSSYFVAQETGDRLEIFGAESLGHAVFEPTGRMVVLITSGGRVPAQASSD